MTDTLKTNLFTKHELRFNKNENFKILVLSDLQESLDYDKRTLLFTEYALEKEQPDLVILGGDNCDGHIIKTEKEFQKYLEIFTAPMENRSIPWAHVFGNHDHDIIFDNNRQQDIYEAFSNCISKRSPCEVFGITNFVLPIKSANSDKIAFNIWCMDSNNSIHDFASDYPDYDISRNFMLPKKPNVSNCWDIIRFQQLIWYWNCSLEMERFNGAEIDAIMIMHIAPWEFEIIALNPKETGANGSMAEKMGFGFLNSGLFSTVIQRGDVRCIACGHTHQNTFEGLYCNIKLCFNGCAGFSSYGKDELRGCRVFKLNERNTKLIETYMVYAKDLL